MGNELSLVSVVLFIAIGTLVFFLLFLFAKRQITRFTLKSTRRPHEAIGADSPKEMRQEIRRRLDRVNSVKFEPFLIHDRCEAKPDSIKDPGVTCNYKYRMLAVDAFKSIDVTLTKLNGAHTSRHPNTSVRHYLLSLHHKGPLLSATPQLMHDFADCYDHARHSPKEFGQDQYKNYIELLQRLIDCLQAEAPQDSLPGDLEKVDTEVVYHENCTGASGDIMTLPIIRDNNSDCTGVLHRASQTRLRNTSSKTRSLEQQGLLLEDLSPTQNNEDKNDREERLTSNADSIC